MKRFPVFFVLLVAFFCAWIGEPAAEEAGYTVGVDDILDINVLQPDPLGASLTVSPDGTITFPYIGNVKVAGLTLIEVQEKIQSELSGYMKYPMVAVSLKESRSRTFYVYGEVVRPGSYAIQPNITAVRAISLAGGFTKFGSSNRVRILRHKKDGAGDETIKVDIKAAMAGDSVHDVRILPGDVITVSEGMF